MVNIEDVKRFDLTPDLPVEGMPLDFDYFDAVAALGNVTFRLSHQSGHPTNLNLQYESDGNYPNPYHWDFWVPPGVTPVFKASKQADGSLDVRASLPGVGRGESALPSVITAAYNFRLPDFGYSGGQTRLLTLERAFHVLEGGTRSHPNMKQLEPLATIRSLVKAVGALSITDGPRLNGRYGFSADH